MNVRNNSFAGTVLFVSLFFILFTTATGGNLNPPAAPSSGTMKTLDEVEPRIPIPASDTPTSTFTISESGSYYLVGNRSCSDIGINVSVDDVTIDLCGYALIGPGDYTGILMSGRNNVEIRNGTIRNFSDAVYESLSTGRGHRIISVRAIANINNGINLYSTNNTITDCIVMDNGTGASFDVYGIKTGDSSILTHNTANHNGQSASGIYVCGIDTGSDCTLTGNTAINNGYSAASRVYGIHASQACTLNNNTAQDNGISSLGNVAAGIVGSTCCTMNNNAARNNGGFSTGPTVYGIYGSSGCILNGNSSCYNGEKSSGPVYGIRADSGSVLKNNTSLRNGQNKTGGSVYGIYGGQGVTVSGNTSSVNGYGADSISICGFKVYSHSTVISNTAYYNGGTATNCSVYGLEISTNCLVDQNTASANNGTNMFASPGCVLGTNCAP